MVQTLDFFYLSSVPFDPHEVNRMATTTTIALPLPILPQGWTGEKDFKAVGQLSAADTRTIEPVGPHFLAHARRVRLYSLL